MREVRYERLRPEHIRQQREQLPAVYIPIGTLEWHGPHNPVGLDALKAHALCCRCAQQGGGLVFPPLWYGENRENALLESSCGLNREIAGEYGLPADTFSPGYMGRSIADQDRLYMDLLLHILHQANSLGFKVAVICAGHYPLIDHAKAASHLFHQQTHHRSPERKMIPWVFTGYEFVREKYNFAGDHAAYWETSLLMALDGDPVDLTKLEGNTGMPLGVGGARPPIEANASDGEKYVSEIVDVVCAKVLDRVKDTRKFMPHNLEF